MSFGPNLIWLIRYDPETPTAVFSLIVSSAYAIGQLRLLLRTRGNLTERNVRWWAPAAAVLYAVTLLIAANWPGIGE
jgi:hypothetical protein